MGTDKRFSTSLVETRDVHWSKLVGTGKERNAFPFETDLSLSHFFSFFPFFRICLLLSFLSLLGLVI